MKYYQYYNMNYFSVYYYKNKQYIYNDSDIFIKLYSLYCKLYLLGHYKFAYLMIKSNLIL